jgi:hypothetical protein
MAIWKLSPIDLTDRNWQTSTHKGVAIVRAPSEEVARRAASLAFNVATRVVLGETTKVSPWPDFGLVDAQRLENERWPAAGDVEILDPPHHNDELAGVRWE